ncbi:MAG: prepilin-type N-terminal cleavage/methylation domain-containing protein [Candidatus Parabeggiatoa sp.]|nr:prepilin-type N-terminal cleavage/methylation domain-containing protein [Candidatus Parabeggiatoa sp.]
MKTQKGFSLIELMIVVAISGILITFVFPTFKLYLTKAALSEISVGLGAFSRSLESYGSESCVEGATGSPETSSVVRDIEILKVTDTSKGIAYCQVTFFLYNKGFVRIKECDDAAECKLVTQYPLYKPKAQPIARVWQWGHSSTVSDKYLPNLSL